MAIRNTIVCRTCWSSCNTRLSLWFNTYEVKSICGISQVYTHGGRNSSMNAVLTVCAVIHTSLHIQSHANVICSSTCSRHWWSCSRHWDTTSSSLNAVIGGTAIGCRIVSSCAFLCIQLSSSSICIGAVQKLALCWCSAIAFNTITFCTLHNTIGSSLIHLFA